jgi:hypothetical protein
MARRDLQRRPATGIESVIAQGRRTPDSGWSRPALRFSFIFSDMSPLITGVILYTAWTSQNARPAPHADAKVPSCIAPHSSASNRI